MEQQVALIVAPGFDDVLRFLSVQRSECFLCVCVNFLPMKLVPKTCCWIRYANFPLSVCGVQGCISVHGVFLTYTQCPQIGSRFISTMTRIKSLLKMVVD